MKMPPRGRRPSPGARCIAQWNDGEGDVECPVVDYKVDDYKVDDMNFDGDEMFGEYDFEWERD